MLSSGTQLSSSCPQQHPEGSWAPPAALQHSHTRSRFPLLPGNVAPCGERNLPNTLIWQVPSFCIWPLVLPSEKDENNPQHPCKPQIYFKLQSRFNIWNALYCQKKSISINYVILSNGSFCLFLCSKFAEATAPTAFCQNTREERMTRKEKEERRAKT